MRIGAHSSRQFPQASAAYLEAAQNKQVQFQTIEALKKWLIVQTRVSANPLEAEKTLENLFPSLNLPRYEKDEVQNWISSLKNWRISKQKLAGLTDAEQLIRQSVLVDPLSNNLDEVAILRATGLLHNILSTLKSKEDRSRALFLLGFAYNKLQSFLIDELPELYLKLSIEENPGSKTAKDAFNLYRDIVTISFTGSGGTDIPSDVKADLDQLHSKAFNIPPFPGKM